MKKATEAILTISFFIIQKIFIVTAIIVATIVIILFMPIALLATFLEKVLR